jgi:hypothetical protein
MEDKLVNICIKILRLLPPDGLHVNAIFKQTGLSYKPDLVKAVRILGKGKLIMETETPAHKQKKIKKLTELGYEYKNLMLSIEEYDKAFSEFERCRVEKFPVSSTLRPSDIPVPSILRSRGWSSEEIDKYEETWLSTIEIKDFLIKNIFNALISRYAAIVPRIGNNNIARDILIKFVTNQIAHQLSIISNESDYPMNTVFQDLTSVMDEVPDFYHNPEYFLYNHFINNEIKNVIALLLYLVTPRNVVKNHAEMNIANLMKSIKGLEELPTKRKERKYGAELRGNKELLSIFETLLQIIFRYLRNTSSDHL